MTRRRRALFGALIGVLLCAGLGLFALLSAGGLRRPGEKTVVTARKLLPFDTRKLVRIEIDTKGQRLVLAKSANAWRLLRPVSAATDDAVLAALLKALSKSTVEQVAAAGDAGAASDYGLDPPRARISLLSDAGDKLVWLVGSRARFPDKLYLRREGQPGIVCLDGEFEEILLPSSFDLRRKRLLQFEPRRLGGLLLKNGQSICEFRLRKRLWQKVKPGRGQPVRAAIELMVASLHGLQAVAFPGPRATLSHLGLDRAGITVELYGPDRRPLGKLALGAAPGPDGKISHFARRLQPPGLPARIGDYQFINIRRAATTLCVNTKPGSPNR